MTKKDYVLLSNVINKQVIRGYDLAEFVDYLSDALERDNPLFSRDKFEEACFKRDDE